MLPDWMISAHLGCVDVNYNGQKVEMPVMVVDGNVSTLLGRDWLKKIKLK